jgi:hypothetical protein
VQLIVTKPFLIAIKGVSTLVTGASARPGNYRPPATDEVAALLALIVTVNAWNAVAVDQRP